MRRNLPVQFGPDGLLYVITGGTSGIDGDIRCYNPITKQFQGTFIPNGSGGLDSPRGMVWRPTPRPGDCDGDFHVDADDDSELLSCLDGPGWLVDWPCDCFDLADRDGCVDLRDFATFLTLFLGDND